MKKEINLIFPHQLFEAHPVLESDAPTYFIEEYLFFNQYKFHKQKIVFHRASMKAFQARLTSDHSSHYIDAQQEISDIRKLVPYLAERGCEQINVVDPTDDWLLGRLLSAGRKLGITVKTLESPLFLNTKEDNATFFKEGRKKFFQTKFYITQRKRWNILLEEGEKPVGGKWSFDADNRKKYPAKKEPPPIQYPDANEYYLEAIEYVDEFYPDNPGKVTRQPLYPYTSAQSKDWLTQFLQYRFHDFGAYEDAIVKEESILNHSVLTPMLNVGLLSPGNILDEAMSFAEKENVPINSTEGFVRQIIGWREFIRGIYELKGREERTKNYWGFNRKLPKSFYDGSTGIAPFDMTIRKVLQTGYCHHIERLMILGNFMLLCEIDPDEVYRWFMELFIDSYDWVMVPNVYGMSQFADAGIMSTKPYISGSNYILKMSNYKKGDWQHVWDGLFWRFMHVHRDFFSSNPRMKMLIGNFDKMDEEKRERHLSNAERFLTQL